MKRIKCNRRIPKWYPEFEAWGVLPCYTRIVNIAYQRLGATICISILLKNPNYWMKKNWTLNLIVVMRLLGRTRWVEQKKNPWKICLSSKLKELKIFSKLHSSFNFRDRSFLNELFFLNYKKNIFQSFWSLNTTKDCFDKI